MKDKLFLLIGISIVVWSFYAFLQKPAPAHYQAPISQASIKIGEINIPVEIAETDKSRTQGLSGRATLEAGHGLLFVFETPAKYGFWMKDMNFSIDIVWIDENWNVVGVERLVNPDTYPHIFEPTEPIKYVLELNAGEAVKMGIDTGSKLSLDR